MRADTVNFALKNTAFAKRPKYVVELAFDTDNTILRYFTSHDDCALPPGANAILSVVEGLSGTSQTLNPDTANATIGSISFNLVDRASVITTTLGAQFELGRSTRQQRVRVYVGYEGLAWADYILVQTQLVTQIAFRDGAYIFQCADVQRQMRNDIFDPAKTVLASSVLADDTTINVFDTSLFSMVAHGISYSDAPNATVGYIKIQDEVIRYTGKTATSFTGCSRGALNTRKSDHSVDLTQSVDRRTAVQEYIYLEMPAAKMMLAILTGELYGQGGARLPSSWNLGISSAYIRQADYTGIGVDLWDLASDEQGFIARFEDLSKTDGKKFLEQELAMLSGVFMPIYADGAVGLKRMANVLAGASYVQQLDVTNIVSYEDLVHDFNSLHNVMQVTWNWEAPEKQYTRFNILIDANSIRMHGRATPLKLTFRGLHGSRHSAVTLAQRFDALRDRYTGPPLRTSVNVVPSLNRLEVGDVVRLNTAGIRDFIVSGALDRSFEIQNIQIDWVTGAMSLRLFASSQAPGAMPPTTDSSVLPDAWYSHEGINLTSVLTITGSNPGHISANGNLAGRADLNDPNAIYYYDGDLILDSGVTVTFTQNIQLRVKGFFQINGNLDGTGRGLIGAADGGINGDTDYNAGLAGYLGTTEAGGGIRRIGYFYSLRGGQVQGKAPAVETFTLDWDGTSLSGLPTDLRGTSGSSGMPSTAYTSGGSFVSRAGGGAGGNGGSGLAVVCRGFNLGTAGIVNTTGGDGHTGNQVPSRTYFAGSGGGGAPGGLLMLLDGAQKTATGMTIVSRIANFGLTPIIHPPFDNPGPTGGGLVEPFPIYSYYVGTGDGTTFPLPTMSGSLGGTRVQYIPGLVSASPDTDPNTLDAPSSFGLASGTSELLVQGDGTIIPRIKATWMPVLDDRVLVYELQFKRSTDSVWSDAPTINGRTSNTSWITNVRDGIAYDVRIRAAGDTRQISEWLTITDYVVIGKTQPPSDITSFTIEGTVLSWGEVGDVDRDGYLLRYQPGTSRSWGDAITLHNGVVTNSPYDMLVVPSGNVTLMAKAIDTSGNESVNPAYITVDLGDPDTANIVETFDIKADGFTGTKTNSSVSGGNLVADSVTPASWRADDTTNWWSTDSSTLMWATIQYAAMTYEDSIRVSQAGVGAHMTIQSDITGDPWSIEYCIDTGNPAWNSIDSTVWWNANSATPFWSPRQFLPWPGQIDVDNIFYAFRINAGQASTQGQVREFTILIDMPDIEEFLDNAIIASGGTRLPITNTYRAIKNVQLTVQADGGTAISARTEDKNATLGPLVRGIDAAGSFTSALVDARVQGY